MKNILKIWSFQNYLKIEVLTIKFEKNGNLKIIWKLKFGKLNLKIIQKLEFWKLLGNWSFSKIKFKNWNFENWSFENFLKIGVLKIISKLKFWELNLKIGVLKIGVSKY